GQKRPPQAPSRQRPGRSQARASGGLRPCPAAARRPPWRRPERPGRCSMTTEPFVRTFGLTDLPFSKEIPDSELWLPPSKQALVDELCEAVEQRAQVLLVGEPGVGKTCVLRALRHRLPPPQFRLTYCHNATLGRRDFYRQLCVALGLTPAATAAGVFYAV